jgi:formylglycine-generating enzyme required for sulfatase activity
MRSPKGRLVAIASGAVALAVLVVAQRTDPNGPSYDQEAGDDEEPVREVSLRPFLIAKHEVTRSQWRGVMGMDRELDFLTNVVPAQVSTENSLKFCEKLRLELPNKAQGEYARRTGITAPIARDDSPGIWSIANHGFRPAAPAP